MMLEGWALLCEIGLWGWIASVVGLILNAFPSGNIFRKQQAFKWGGALIVFYSIWITGMSNS